MHFSWLFEGFKGDLFKHTKTFFCKMFFSSFFSIFMKNAFDTNSRFFFSPKNARSRKERTDFFKNYFSGTQLYLWIWSPFYLSYVTCHQHQQLKPQTLPLLTPPLFTLHNKLVCQDRFFLLSRRPILLLHVSR